MAGAHATGIDAVEHARKLVGYGAGEILLTSMDRDGTKSGYDLALTRAVADAVQVPVIASGGVGTLDDLVEGVTRRPCQRGAGGLHLPFRRSQHRRGQGRARSHRRAICRSDLLDAGRHCRYGQAGAATNCKPARFPY